MSAAAEKAERLRMIRDSAASVEQPGKSLRRIRDLRFTEPGFDRAVWSEMAGMGWIGLRLPEDRGGFAMGVAEACVISEVMGGALTPEPLDAVAMAAAMLPAAALPPVLSGDLIVIPAWQERAGALGPSMGGVTLANGRLHGTKLFVASAAGADSFLVTIPGGSALVSADAPGLSISLDRTQDGGHFGTLTFDGAPAQIVESDGADALEVATLTTAAALLGLMERAFSMTLDYMRTRQQFGKLIGSFQALQHRAADLRIQIALTRASVDDAASVLDEAASSPDQRRAAVSRAKARASDAGLLVTRTCIQLHGGIGYTDDADIGLFLRRAMVLSSLYGNAAAHRTRYASLAADDAE